MKAISSISKGPRQSNFELLRIIAMFFILIVHANFLSIGGLSYNNFINSPSNAFLRTFFESISIACVNVFVMISGWFGIRANMKGFLNLIFQCIYFYLGIYLVSCLVGFSSFSLSSLSAVILFTGKTAWFIKAYIALYILSPMINIFLEKASKRNIEIFLIGFYIFQTLYWYTESTPFIASGYSTFSFIGLYVLAHYLKNWGSKFSNIGIYLYIGSVIILIGLFYFNIFIYPLTYIYAYSDPFVVLSASGLILWANSLKIKTNKKINFISKSAFAVFLFHTCPGAPFFFGIVIYKLYLSFSGIPFLLLALLFLVLVFFLAILLDQPRKFIWKYLSKLIFTTNN